MLVALFMIIFIYHGLMLGCVLQFTNDGVGIGEVAKAVMFHDIEFLEKNCDYPKARRMCLILFVLVALIGNISIKLL